MKDNQTVIIKNKLVYPTLTMICIQGAIPI